MTDLREDKSKTPRDWRGTEIKIGDPVIYGGPVGRSIQLVEAEVVGFTKAGRVNLKVIRRAYSQAWSGDKRVVHVGMDRLIVVNPDGLPPTTLPTWEEAIDAATVRSDELDRIAKTHQGPTRREVPYEMPTGWGDRAITRYRGISLPCTACGDVNRYERECPGVPA